MSILDNTLLLLVLPKTVIEITQGDFHLFRKKKIKRENYDNDDDKIEYLFKNERIKFKY